MTASMNISIPKRNTERITLKARNQMTCTSFTYVVFYLLRYICPDINKHFIFFTLVTCIND